MVQRLDAVLSDGLVAVEEACAEALKAGLHSSAVILNLLARQRQPATLWLRHEPTADCARYAACGARIERTEVLNMLEQFKLLSMRAAFDEALAAGLNRRFPVQQIIGELLRAQSPEKQARSIKPNFLLSDSAK
jgi:hypothetical protein